MPTLPSQHNIDATIKLLCFIYVSHRYVSFVLSIFRYTAHTYSSNQWPKAYQLSNFYKHRLNINSNINEKELLYYDEWIHRIQTSIYLHKNSRKHSIKWRNISFSCKLVLLRDFNEYSANFRVWLDQLGSPIYRS